MMCSWSQGEDRQVSEGGDAPIVHSPLYLKILESMLIIFILENKLSQVPHPFIHYFHDPVTCGDDGG